jgi:hypothetical protein
LNSQMPMQGRGCCYGWWRISGRAIDACGVPRMLRSTQ